MTNIKGFLEDSNYFKVISPTEIKIDKEEIFYRDKYNEIINYIKFLLTDSNELEINNYIKPKGTLLVNINPGTDIIDFVKLISNHYYLELVELNIPQIYKKSNEFFNNIYEIIKEYVEKIDFKNEKSGEKNKEGKITLEKNNQRKRLFLINFPAKLKEHFRRKNLLNNFIIMSQDGDQNKINFIEKNTILIWISYDYQEIKDNSEGIFDFFDLFIKIPLLNRIERETILRNFLEKYNKIAFDVDLIVNYTENWEVNDIKRLLKLAIFKQHLNSDLNDKSNEITNIIIDLITSGEYIPFLKQMNSDEIGISSSNEKKTKKLKQESEIKQNNNEEIKDFKFFINKIREDSVSEFMLNQLYENAASKNYKELVIIIDKLNKNELLEENDRRLLALYPFILNDTPNRAQFNLEKAKKKVDLLKQAFRK
ncbi:MAG: hypothetical protein ACTSPD_05340 [Promethearchaeota archaeon]